MRAVGWLGTSFVWVGLSEPLMLAYMSQSTWVGNVEGGLGGASCMLMRRAVRQTRVATGGQAPEHQARATWVNMLLCARWRVTHLFWLLRISFIHDTHNKTGSGSAFEMSVAIRSVPKPSQWLI